MIFCDELRLCKNIDDCSKVASLMDRDWWCDFQFADSVRIMCSRCEKKE